jgi:hypothetical protein
MPDPEPLLYRQYYHIYNRGNNGETLFREERNYPYWFDGQAGFVTFHSSSVNELAIEPLVVDDFM